jgi:hypothetical protein
MQSGNEYNGFWWLPDNPNLKFPGLLRVEEAGIITLSLIVAYDHYDLFDDGRMSKAIPVLNGYARHRETRDDITFSLFGNNLVSSHRSGLAEIKLGCEYFITNKHLPAADSFTIGSISLRVQLLDDWVKTKGFKTVRLPRKDRFSFGFEYEQPDQIDLYENSEFAISLWFRADSSQKQKSVSLVESNCINIEFKDEVSFQHAKELVEIVKNFFSFCIGLPLRAEQMRFQQQTWLPKEAIILERRQSHDLCISDTRYGTKRLDLQPDLMLIDYSTMSKKQGSFLEKWFSMNTQLEPVLRLYFDTIHNPDLYKENVFLNYVAALEVYHRIVEPGFDGKEEDYHEVLTRILNQISAKNEKEWLITRLGRKKETKLHDRVLALLRKTPGISARLARSMDLKSFATLISDTRNYLTHFNIRKKDAVIAKGAELHTLMHKCRVLMQIQLLMELGFNENEIDPMIMKALSNWVVWQKV